MITVMLADDEHLIRQLVKKSVNWTEFDMSVMWEAGDGETALKMIRENRPDVALIDINMPFMTGVELAKAVCEEELPTKVVFLTGYQEFEYARKALEYHVFDYILKPIRTEELESVLRRLEKDILQDRKNGDKAKVSMDMEEMDLLRRIAVGKAVIAEEKLPDTWDDLIGGKYCVLLLRPDHVQHLENLQALLFRILQKAWAFLEEKLECRVLGYLERDKYDVLIMGISDMGEDVQERAELLRKHIGETEEYTVTIGISDIHDGLGELSSGLEEAIQAGSKRFNGRYNTVYTWDMKLAEQETHMRARAQEVLELLETFSRKRLLKQEDDLDKFLEVIREKELSEDYAKILAIRLIAITISFERRGAEYGVPFSQFYGSIMRCEQLSDVERLCHQWMQYERKQNLAIRGKKYSDLVRRSRDYINQNYADHDLSLNQIATAMNVNPAYLSNLFKQEMGLTITEFITACRMGQAAEILNNTSDCTLAELSERVGYNDPYYFSRSFKKYYGVSPLRYRLENDG